MNDQIKRTLKLLPDRPGVYIMKNNGGQIIYVGKAKNLANRVRSYFHTKELTAKTRALVESVCDLSYIVLDSELEALLLENNLIKKHKPYYNILLKDDKGYPYIRLDKGEYPTLTLARRLVHDGAEYFGPFFGAGLARDIIDAVTDIYPLRSCSADIARRKGKMRPCVKYSIGKCVGPCRAEYPQKQYKELVKEVSDLLGQGYGGVSEIFKQRMQRASQIFDYEKAAYYRDRMMQLEKIGQSQKAVLTRNTDLDAIAVSLRNDYAVFALLTVRGGRLINVNTSGYQISGATAEELTEQFILQKYRAGDVIPKEILLGQECSSQDVLQQHLTDIAGHKVTVNTPKRGEKAGIIKLALSNAAEVLEKSLSSQNSKREHIRQGLEELECVLKLEGVPHRIECFDISHIQGTDTVASMTVLTDGEPNKREYRHFKIKHGLGNNDFASMAEVIKRRFLRAVNKDEGFSALPDLLVIDGGKGQLSSAIEVLNELNLKLKVIGLAERFEEIYLPTQSLPLILEAGSPALHLLQTVRDEAHRFAVSYHRSLRGKRSLLSRLDNVKGIGEKRKKALFKAFGSVDAISKATVDELAAVDGMNLLSARAVAEYFAINNEK